MEVDGLKETEDLEEEEVVAEEVEPSVAGTENDESQNLVTENEEAGGKASGEETEISAGGENMGSPEEENPPETEEKENEIESSEAEEIQPQKVSKSLESSSEERKSLSTIQPDSGAEALSVFKKRKTMEFDSDSILTDAELDGALEDFAENADPKELEELLVSMNTNNIIRWDEAERILAEGERGIIKSGLPELSRPDEPENETDVDDSIQKLLADHPDLTQINLNNMKRTPIPKVQRLILAAKDNTHLTKLSLSNIGLTDSSAEPLLELLSSNSHLKSLCLDTNYLSGEFTSKLIEAATAQQTLEELRISNQSMTFSSSSEMGIMKAMQGNTGICKLGLAIRSQEARTKVEQIMFRNCESNSKLG